MRLEFLDLELHASAADHIIAPSEDTELAKRASVALDGAQFCPVVGDELRVAELRCIDHEALVTVGVDGDTVEGHVPVGALWSVDTP